MNNLTSPGRSTVAGALFGVAVGDALGVPVEFSDRSILDKNPVTGMQGYGTWNQPPGTWSDDSSLTFCLAEELCRSSPDPDHLGSLFLRWYREAWWTAHDQVFDIGGTTSEALHRLELGIPAISSGPSGERQNGNGALMRMLPLVFSLNDMADEQARWTVTCCMAGITHGHIRSHLACHIYLEMARQIMEGHSLMDAYIRICHTIPNFCSTAGIPIEECDHYSRMLDGNLQSVERADIRGSGYVVQSLEAALWCLLTTSSYADAVLIAVNLGEDTDTTAAVCGGLAGLHYGVDSIPTAWRENLAKANQIEELSKRLQHKCNHL
ncbi:MAG: ADP-ribosylglycohydrolase family protein [Saprospiraceae bacterium]|nr:ADP-ribosylglycohydrolase family protein [Saprospiraceae bacterium]